MKIDAKRLAQWADSLEAKAELPKLIRHLVWSGSATIQREDFKAGEDVALAGWDGTVEALVGDAFIPSGISGWELSTDKVPGRKANGDFSKRTTDPGSLCPADSTYVAVTLRRWAGREKWESEKKKSIWKDVRAIDAGVLEQWIEQAPAVALWLQILLGGRPPGLRSLAEEWLDYASATEPSFPVEVLLCDRGAEAAELQQWLSKPPSVREIEAETPEEVAAFVWAVLQNSEDRWKARTIVLDHGESWAELAPRESGLLVILKDGSPGLPTRIQQSGSHVLIPVATRGLKTAIGLKRPHAFHLTDALVSALSLPRGRAENLAKSSRGSLTALRRLISASPALARPVWAEFQVARGLVPILLANAWNSDGEGDQRVVAQLVGESHDVVIDRMMSWIGQTDPPVRLRGRIWELNAPLDAWRQLARYVRDEDLRRFRQVALEVLSETDPSYSMPINERWLANIHQKTLPHSPRLRSAIVTNLAIVADLGERGELINVTFPAQNLVDMVVRDLLSAASSERWYSVRDVLPGLAEAAPSEFLDALDRDLRCLEPAILALFSEEKGEAPGFTKDSGHPALLWALERLAWSSRFFTRASLALAALAEKFPEGGLGNRPARSLSQIFLGFYRNTEADWEVRLETLDLLVERQHRVGWKLLLSLIRQETYVIPTSRPELRDWGHHMAEEVSEEEYLNYSRAISQRALRTAEKHPENWAELVSFLPSLSPEFQHQILDLIRSVGLRDIPEQVRPSLREAVRALVCDCRRFRERILLGEEDLLAWEEILAGLQASSLSDQISWLFDRVWVDLPSPDPEDIQAREAEVERLRREAITELHRVEGIGGVLRFASQVKEPGEVGHTAAEVVRPSPDLEACELLRGSDGALSVYASSYLYRRSILETDGWAATLVERILALDWTLDDVVLVCMSFRSRGSIWQLVQHLGSDVERSYWKRVVIGGLERSDDLEEVVQKLFDARRPDAAVSLLMRYYQRGVDPELAVQALERLAAEPEAEGTGRRVDAYKVEYLFDVVQRSDQIDAERVQRTEWQYLLALDRFGAWRPKSLFRAMAKDPGFFSGFVSAAYGLGSQVSGPKEGEAARELLHWAELIPGMGDDGKIDGGTLCSWTQEVLHQCGEQDCAEEGATSIGRILARCGKGSDGFWPVEPIRDLLEKVVDSQLELGLIGGFFDSRGATRRTFDEGGDQERTLETKYRDIAKIFSTRWPRTSALLERIAAAYASQGRGMDLWVVEHV